MKKYPLLAAFVFTFCCYSRAQILCIYCYDQNDSLSDNVNNLLLNGGFKNGCGVTQIFCPNSNYYACDITNWTCTGGGVNTYAHIVGMSFTQIVDGSKAAYFGNAQGYPCSQVFGDTSCIEYSNCTATGIPVTYPISEIDFGGAIGVSLEQTTNGLVPGNTYVLEFWAGGENMNLNFVSSGLFAVDVGFGDTLLRDRPTEPVTGIGTRYIIEFNATSSSHTIKFTNWGHICDSCTELVLDDVRLYTLAELSPLVPHCTTGIDIPNSQNLEYMVSPNPFSEELTFKTKSNELNEVVLYDIASKKLMDKTFVNSVSINTEQLSQGIYIYEIKNAGGTAKRGKIVKE